jgi:hypothetical protein
MLPATSIQHDDCASSTPPSEASGSSSENSRKKRKSRCGSVFRSWQFHFVIKTDLCHGPTAAEKDKLLREHLSARTGHYRPFSISGVVVFCDRSLYSQPPDSDGLISIEVIGYVQANNTVTQTTMKKWMDSATWKPVEGGLTSNKEYMSNMRRFQDPNDEWTRLMLYGNIGANNVTRSEEKAAKRQALADITDRAPSRPASDTSSSRGSASTGAFLSGTRLLLAHPPRPAILKVLA